MIKISNETKKRLFFAIILIAAFVPTFILAPMFGSVGKIISLVTYSLACAYAAYELFMAVKINRYIAIGCALLVPIFLILPWNEFKSFLTADEVTSYKLSILSSIALKGWEQWIFIISFSFVPMLINGNKDSNVSYFKKQLAITVSMILLGVLCNLVWLFNTKNFISIMFFILIAVLADVGGYFGGKLFGKKWFNGKKLAPKISPKKTWAGFIWGYTLSSTFAILCGYFTGIWSDFGSKELLVSILFGLILPIIAVLGDLLFSTIKRLIKIKDFSNLLPGHGGLLDRFDSIAAVFFFSGLFLLMA